MIYDECELIDFFNNIPQKDDEYFCWEIGPTNDLATIVECDEVYNLKDELKELLENYLAEKKEELILQEH